MRSRISFAVLLLVPACLLIAGCGGGHGPLAPVEGKVLLNGKPLPAGQVSLWPENAESKARPIGKVENGSYSLTTDGKPGAPLGKYKITVAASVPSSGGVDPSKLDPKGAAMPPTLNPRYGSAKDTPLQYEVKTGAAAGSYDLNLKK